MKYVAFLSYAHHDEELVECLKSLFKQLNKEVFYSQDELPKAKTEEWRRTIIDAIRNSACFVPVYTRNSLKREWVLYESGIADALDIARLPARVASVSNSDIKDLPSPDAFVYDLSNINLLADLITKACVLDGENEDTYSTHVLQIVLNSPLAKKICRLSKTRWIFVAGNYPENASLPDSGIDWFTTREDYLGRLKRFCEMLTVALLDESFNVSACPQVEVVGMHVISKAVDYLVNVPQPSYLDFSIGGIYPIDREARQSSLSEIAKKKWLDHIMEFRKSYLSNQEWLILVGGNEGTREEYNAAISSKVKVMIIRCFGGEAAVIGKERKDLIRGPCTSCLKQDGNCNIEDFKKIASSLKA